MAVKSLVVCGRSRSVAFALVAVVGGLTMPSAALAWEAGVDGSSLRIVAAAGEANRMNVDVAPGGNLIVTDEAGPVTMLGAGCSDPDGEGTATCARAGITRVVIDTDDLDDAVSVGDIGLPVEVRAGAGNDQVSTGASDDLLDGGSGNDTLDAGAGNDRLIGGDGDDQLLAGTGQDHVDAGAGDDTIDGDLGADVIVAGAGDDQADGGPGNDQVDGGDGNDQLTGSDGDDVLTGGAGQDRISGDEGSDRIDGGADADDLDGGGGTDQVLGGSGNDLLQSTAGGDLLDGGEGDDQLEGDDQPGTLTGGPGNDVLNGYGGADLLDGGGGDDQLAGGTGADQVVGGGGRDTVSYDDALQGVSVSLNGLADDGTPGEGDNIAGDTEVVIGSPADDTLNAGDAPVELHGGSGNDRLTGGPGADLLDGGDGDDLLDGGAGPDVLTGAEGSDTVSYAARPSPVTVSIGTAADDGQAGERDDVRSDVETVIGTAYADRLTAAANLSVTLDGGAGNDLITLPKIAKSSDVGNGQALCGTGTDTVTAAGEDTIGGDCDIVTVGGRLARLGVQGEPSPRLRVTISKVRLGKDRVLRIPIYCGTETSVRCTTTVNISRNGKRLGSTRAVVGRGRSATVRVKLKGSQVTRLLRSGGAVVVGLSVKDKAGKTASGKAAVAVKRAR
ncbi:calcium-binding protein [Patulibacter medicamentivorans]|uniref:calcium-binding protein n=1 Tax=Patulibacter medicamentivorans TaxID=1097667 RepID=UPI001110507F|nr:calcium-binding protein [Patulibacter medicamentivorans]